MKYDIPYMTTEAVSLLKSLISIPSISREETQAADFLQNYIEMAGMQSCFVITGVPATMSHFAEV